MGTAAVLLCLLAGGWLYLHDRDSRLIRKRFAELERTLTKQGPENQVMALARAQGVTAYLASDAVIRIDPIFPYTLHRGDIPGLAFRVRSMVDHIHFRAFDRQIELDATRTAAKMRVTIRGTVEMNGGVETQIHEFEIDWVKEDGDWVIQSARVVQGIRRPPA